MKYLRKNLLSMEISLRKKMEHVQADTELSLHPTRSGWPTIQVTLNGRRRYLHSTVHPLRESERMMQNPGNYVVVLGFGCAYHIQSLLKDPQVRRIVVIEPRIAYVRFAVEHLDLVALFSNTRVHFLLGETPQEVLRHILGEYFPLRYPRAALLPLQSRLAIEPEQFADFIHAIQTAFSQQQADYHIMQVFGKRWVVNILRNLSFLSSHPPRPFPRYTATPALLIAAGPTTELMCRKIRSFSGPRWAVDAILPYLLSQKIVPDVVVSIDCQIWGYLHYPKKIPSQMQILCDLSALFPRHRAQTMYFMGNHPMMQYFSSLSLPTIPLYGKNVTASAYLLMKMAGITDIQTIGADFTYPEGKTHARNTYALRDVYSNRLDPGENRMMHQVFSDSEIERHEKSGISCYQSPLFAEYQKEFLALQSLDIPPWKDATSRDTSGIMAEYTHAMQALHAGKTSSLAVEKSLLPLAAWVAAHRQLTDYENVIHESARLTLHLIHQFFHR